MKTIIALLALALPAQAGTIVHNVTVPLGTAQTGVVEIPAFDPALGTLTDVYVSGFVDFQFTYRAENQVPESPGSVFYGGDCPGQTSNWSKLIVSLPSSGKKLVNSQYTLSDMTIGVEGYDGITDFGGYSGFTLTWYTTVPMDPVTRIRNPLYLSEFYGTGTVPCPYARSVHVAWCADFFSGYVWNTLDSAWYGVVTYVYN